MGRNKKYYPKCKCQAFLHDGICPYGCEQFKLPKVNQEKKRAELAKHMRIGIPREHYVASVCGIKPW